MFYVQSLKTIINNTLHVENVKENKIIYFKLFLFLKIFSFSLLKQKLLQYKINKHNSIHRVSLSVLLYIFSCL